MRVSALLLPVLSSLLSSPLSFTFARPHSIPRDHAGDDGSHHIGRGRGVDISKYRLPLTGEYANMDRAATNAFTRLAKRGTYTETATEFVRMMASNATFRLRDDHYVGSNGVAHVYFRQTVHDVDVDNGDFNVNIGPDGHVLSYENDFYKGPLPDKGQLRRRDFVDPHVALQGLSDTLGLDIASSKAFSEPKDNSTDVYSVKGASGAANDPEARLVYIQTAEDEVDLAWRLETELEENWLVSYVDSQTVGKIHGIVDYVHDLASYKVLPWGTDNLNEGKRVIVKDPFNKASSKYQWHSLGHSVLPTTIGNNAVAQYNPKDEDEIANMHRPAKTDFNFDFDFKADTANPADYVDASITQIFYTANVYHDLMYSLGFTEKAGNFQSNNGEAGGKGNDRISLNVLSGLSKGARNNAFFVATPDGAPGKLAALLFEDEGGARRDSAMDPNILIHELTHGVSSRLTGGPSTASCLSSVESGGLSEGWSDFVATAVRLKRSDDRTRDCGIAEWSAPGYKHGIREFPYSTDMATNPMTYATVDKNTEGHAAGTVWAAMLYEVLWNLIDKHPMRAGQAAFEGATPVPARSDAGVPLDGRYLAIKLVVDAMALQPCNPSFVDARDAILDADAVLTKAANRCEIWRGFAKRGLGTGAVYRKSGRADSFTVPDECRS